MDNWFSLHNSHLKDPAVFSTMDPALLRLKEQRLIYPFSLLERLPKDTPGIYTLCGAHQTGKTTLLKMWIEKLLADNIPANAIVYFSGENISGYNELYQKVRKHLSSMSDDHTRFIIIDDIHFIKDADKAISQLKNSELIDTDVLFLSSSDSTVETSDQKNAFHLYPLSFRETVLLKINNDEPSPEVLYQLFNEYLIHGGNLNAINEMAIDDQISDKTLIEYGQWIRQQTEKKGKQEIFLREIVKAILKHYNSQVTWNSLMSELNIDHPKTIGDYFSWLEALDIIFVQSALLEDKLEGAPKKARKIICTDPFYYHALFAWINSGKNHFEQRIKTNLSNGEINSNLVKSCVINQFHRDYPTYYIKAEGEVDLAYVKGGAFWPIEITWISQLRAKDLKQILKYPNGRILTKTERSGIIQHIQTEPLPIALWELEDANTQ